MLLMVRSYHSFHLAVNRIQRGKLSCTFASATSLSVSEKRRFHGIRAGHFPVAPGLEKPRGPHFSGGASRATPENLHALIALNCGPLGRPGRDRAIPAAAAVKPISIEMPRTHCSR